MDDGRIVSIEEARMTGCLTTVSAGDRPAGKNYARLLLVDLEALS
jgi:hypothetical protein